jgi:hypothetical protein
MDGPRRSGPRPADPDGGHRPWRPAPGYVTVALAIVAAVAAYGLMPSSTSVHAVTDGANPAPLPIATGHPEPIFAVRAAAAASAVAPVAPAGRANPPGVPPPAPTQQISRTRDPDGDQTPDLSDYVNPGERPTMAEVIDRLHQAGVYGGLGAFSPPGTRPPLIGLAVPEDFALPEGYVRHYQATDDGQRIEPILMFAPDRQFFDAEHRPIAIPKDRVVPPELAPPGLPLRRIAIPAPAGPGRPGN